MQMLKLRSVELPKGPQKRVFFLIPHRLSPEEDKKKSKRNLPLNIVPSHIAFLKLVVSQKGSASINLTHVVLQRSIAQ